MSKFKVGDEVEMIRNPKNHSMFEVGDKMVIRKIELRDSGYICWFEGINDFGINEDSLKLVESKKTFTIQEVLVEENVGKKFEFRDLVSYELNSSLDLIDERGYSIKENFNLKGIVEGTFTLIEGLKQFTEEIDFKEAFKRLCEGEEVKFEIGNDYYDIFIIEDGVLMFYSDSINAFKEISDAFKAISHDKYKKYYKK